MLIKGDRINEAVESYLRGKNLSLTTMWFSLSRDEDFRS